MYWCVCAGVIAKSKVVLMNESETKRGNAHSLLTFSLSLRLFLISVRVSKRYPHGSLLAMQHLCPQISDLEDPITEHTKMTMNTMCYTYITRSRQSH